VFENRVLRKMFGLGWGNLPKGLRNMHMTIFVIRNAYDNIRMSLADYVTRNRNARNSQRGLIVKLEKK
jgi:hypothetical protein